MTQGKGKSLVLARAANRLHARLAGLARSSTGFQSQPEPRTIGLFARGRQMIAGNFLFAGSLVEAPGLFLWDIAVPDPAFEAELQGFGWLDDLAAVGDSAARSRAQDWTWGWIERFGKGRGPGWTPNLTGRRVIRWINHAVLLLNGRDRTQADAYFRSLSRQTEFLSRRWKAADPGLPRIEALTGLIYAGLSLTGMERHVQRARLALAEECARDIAEDGSIPSRNPEELLEIFTLLSWATLALSETGRRPEPAQTAAIERIAPTLRSLRHADGGLARFHGGGRGLEGRLDQALASSGVKPAGAPTGMAMGYARMSGGRTSVIIDAASPPDDRCAATAHASTLAFELTSGRRPLIVSCGSGLPFGPDWRRAGRATVSHSTLALDGYSSSRFDTSGQERLIDRAEVYDGQIVSRPSGTSFGASHDGWSRTHGLTHVRRIDLSHDGRRMVGEDLLVADSPAEQKRFEQVMTHTKLAGVGFQIRFHLHPDVDAALDLGGTAISLALKSGELWIFRHTSGAELRIEPSVYLEKGRLKPRATRQIVLAGHAQDRETRIGWTLAKAQDTPLAIRDLDREDLASMS